MGNLTNSQKSIWVTEQYYRGSSINNICGSAIIEEQLDFDKLEKAIQIVCQKHDNFWLQLKIENGEVIQVLSDEKEPKIGIIKVANQSELEEELEKIVKKPFKLEESDLYKFYIIKFENGEGGFMLNIHHLIADAWTLAFISNEIIKTYSELKQNREVETNAIYSYIDYIKAEEEYLKSEKYQKDKKYWTEKFAQIPEVATIPGSKTNADESNPKGNRRQFNLEVSKVEKIKQYCQENKISLYNFFMAIYAIYIGEISNLDEFVIGTPILNRTNFKEKNAAGMFINMAPFKINMNQNDEFKTFVKNIALDSIGMLKHQKYSYQSLLEDLREKNKNVPNLYNILLSYQITNAHQTGGDMTYKTQWTFNGCCAENIDIQIFDLNDTGSLNIAYDYKTSIYEEKDINGLHKRILNIIDQVITRENIKLKEIEIVTPEEKEKLIIEFNRTELEYDEKETVISLFEKQVEKTPEKIAIICNKEKLTYKELNEKANMLARKMLEKGVKQTDIIGIMINRSPEMIIGLIAILKCGATYLPIDPEYPTERISYMLENSETKLVLVNDNTEKYVSQNCLKINVKNIENTNKRNLNLEIDGNTLVYLIYTSGSTGKPKGVQITNRNLNNFIKGMKKEIDFNENKTMVSVTTICFDIFGLEMWCSLTSGLTLVVANELEQNMPALLNELCLENKVNMIQTTPSRYSVVFEDTNNLQFLDSITEILVGGEALNEKILANMKKYSKARIFNVYGPTETTIWSTIKELTNEEKITVGKPIANTQCYILNKNCKLLPINIPGELYIGGDGVSNGYLKRDDLNKEKFIKSPFIKNSKIYNTNDLAYFTKDGEIVHLGRTDFQVKIRGYRIELGEIENAIEKNGNINQAVVVKRELRNGQDGLIVYYTTNNTNAEHINELKENLIQELPQHMIPQYFVKIEKMPYTPNGKIDRKALPQPDIQESGRMIIKPRNVLDQEIINIIKKMLRIEKISLTDKLLDLGGDSLTAITLSTKILSKYNVQINIKDLISNYTIKDMSDYIKENKEEGFSRIKIEKAPKQEVYPLSSAQRRIYYNSKMIGDENLVYNMPGGILVDEILDAEKVRSVFGKIIERHSTLRTTFVFKDKDVVQKIKEKLEFDVLVYQNTENEIQGIVKNFSKSFELDKDPLIRVELHYIDNKKTLLLVESHHIIMDGIALNNLIIEFERLYNGENLKKIPIEYKDYAIWESKFNESESITKYERYWENKFKNSEFLQLDLPYDYRMPPNRSYKGNKIAQIIDEQKFRRIERYAKKIGASPYMLFISAFFILLYKYTGQEEITLGSPIANRDINETKRMIGMFVNNIVIKANVKSDETFQEFLNQMKEQILDDLSNQPYPFDMLVKKLGIKTDKSKNPLFDVMFTYQNKEENMVHLDAHDVEVIEINNDVAKFNLSLEIKPKTHTINIEYCTDLFKKQTIERMFEHYINVIDNVISDNNVRISDISIIGEIERDKILNKFNNTKKSYPKEMTVAQLVEQQVEKNPNKIAVIFEKKELTYRELNDKANQLASYLRKINIKPNDKVGIMVPRSLELIVAILGTIKAGACYIPIDPSYPSKRVEYMLENSESKILITTELLQNNVECENKILVDFNNKDIYSKNKQDLQNINNEEDLVYIIYTSGSTGNPKGVEIAHKNLCNFLSGVKQIIDFNENKVMLSVTTMSFDIFGLEIWGALTSGMTLVVANEDEQRIPELLNKLCIKNKVNVIQTTPSRFSIMFEESENIEFFKDITDILVGGEPINEKILKNMQDNSDARIFNMYGPTETTIWSTVKELTKEKEITIGKPIANTQVYVLDKNLKIVPIGVTGELYIAGDGVGKGYLNREDITKERYLKNPYLENSIMYKTGDICKFDENGELHYLGRDDNQVKIRGLRIELDEIENRITKFLGVKKAKVVKQCIGKREIISAYFISSKRIRIAELRNYLNKYLPNYMIPTYFTALDEFPYTPNGKIDKNALPIPNGVLESEKNEYIKPKTDLEVKITSVWEEVLNTKRIGIKDNFFELGGDSILAMNLNVKLLKITDKISYSDIFAYPTIEKMAEKIQCEYKEKEKEDLSQLNQEYKEVLEKNESIPKEIKYNEVGNVLITGATGYLGIHILEELLKRENNKIYLLVRKDPGITTKEKVLNKLHYYFGEKYDKYIDDRIIIVQGDVTEDGFGLKQEELFLLVNSIDSIINSAAKVSHYGTYLDFYNVNVKSVEKIINFANAFNKKIYHISTLSVSGNAFSDQYYVEQDLNENIEFYEKNLYIGQKLENVYIRSKFEAEVRIVDAIKKGTNAYILRMGNLMPRLSDGKFQDNIEENAYISRLKSFEKIKCIPDYLKEGYLEFTPIDSAAEAIVKIIEYSDVENRIFHLFNHNHVYVTSLLEIMREKGTDIEILENVEFKKKIKNILNNKKTEILNTLINDLDKDLNLNYYSKITLNSKHTIQLLEKYGFKWPKINKQYILNILKLIKGE